MIYIYIYVCYNNYYSKHRASEAKVASNHDLGKGMTAGQKQGLPSVSTNDG